MVTIIWDSTSNNEIIVQSMAKGLDRHLFNRTELILLSRNISHRYT